MPDSAQDCTARFSAGVHILTHRSINWFAAGFITRLPIPSSVQGP